MMPNRRFQVCWIAILALVILVLGLNSCGESKPQKKPPSFQHVTQKDGLSSEMVYAIAVQGNEVWFGTYAGGATLYDKGSNTWKAYTTKGEPMEQRDDGDSINWKNLLSYNHVSVILPDDKGLWFGTYFYGFGGGGISYYARQGSPQWKKFNTNDGRAKKVISMALEGEFLWVGSEKGLNLFDKRKESWRDFYSLQDGLSGNFVNTLLVEPDCLWVGTNGGISRFQKDKKTWRNYSQQEGLTEEEIRSLVKVGARIWAGGTGGSLFEYDRGSDSWKRIETMDPCKAGGIHSITVTQGKVLVCRDNGVSLYDMSKGSWESLTASDGLLSNVVFCAAGDKDSIWFGTDKGVSRLMLTP